MKDWQKFLVRYCVELVLDDPVDGAACHFPSLTPVKNNTQRHLPDDIELTQLGTFVFSKQNVRKKPQKFLDRCRVDLVLYDPVDGVACHFPSLIPVKIDTQRHLPDHL